MKHSVVGSLQDGLQRSHLPVFTCVCDLFHIVPGLISATAELALKITLTLFSPGYSSAVSVPIFGDLSSRNPFQSAGHTTLLCAI